MSGSIRRIGRRADIGTPVHPHQLRHSFADRVTRLAGLHSAQALLGHSSIQTTEGYLTKPSPDELAEAMARVSLGIGGHTRDLRESERAQPCPARSGLPTAASE